MSLTALNRTMVALLTNNSGGSVAQGDVVIVDSAAAGAFTTTTTAAYASGSVGVVLEPNGIASGAAGIVAFGGYVPKVNLSASASLGDLFKTHTVAKQAVRHASPIVAGDFGQVLATGTAPAAFLFAQPTAAASGGSTSLAGDSDVSISSPADGHALVYNGSAWVNKYPWKSQLAYVAAVDLANAQALTNATWTTPTSWSDQTFTVDSATSLIEIAVAGGVLVGNAQGEAATSVVLDPAGANTRYVLGMAWATGTGNWGNPMGGTSPLYLTGLSAGSHTLRFQVRAEATGLQLYIRPSTHPDLEFLRINVIEHK